jgi:hypothetical protein
MWNALGWGGQGARGEPARRRASLRCAGGRAAALAACMAALAACSGSDVPVFSTPGDAPQSIVLTARALDATTAALEWTSAGSGLAYQVERNGAMVATVGSLQWLDRPLSAGQRYCWRVAARSGFGWQARSNEVCLGTDPGTTDWRVERVATGRWPSVAVDAAGDLHLCFNQGVAGIAYLRVGPGRSPETVDADGLARCSIGVDPGGVVHVAYLSRFGLRHATRGAVAWSAETVDAQALPGAQRFDGPALAFGPDARPRIAYRRLTGSALPTLVVATRDAVGWRFDLTGIPGLVGPRSLAVDAAGTVWLATTDELGQSATAWQRVAAGWSNAYSQSLAPTRGEGPPLALDASGAPRFGWWQRAAPTTTAVTTLRWAESGATGWRSETIDTVATAGFGMAVAMSGAVPRLVSIDEAGALRVHSRIAGAWSSQALDAQGGAAAAVDLAIGPDGQLRMVFDRVVEGSVALASRLP